MWFQPDQILSSGHLDALAALGLLACAGEVKKTGHLCLGCSGQDWLWLSFDEENRPTLSQSSRRPAADNTLGQFPSWEIALRAMGSDALEPVRLWQEFCEWAIGCPCVESPVWIRPQPEAQTTSAALADLRFAAKHLFMPDLLQLRGTTTLAEALSLLLPLVGQSIRLPIATHLEPELLRSLWNGCPSLEAELINDQEAGVADIESAYYVLVTLRRLPRGRASAR